MNNNQHQNNKTKKVTTAIVGGKPINFTSKKQEVTCRHTVEKEVRIDGVETREITTVDIPAAFLNFSGV